MTSQREKNFKLHPVKIRHCHQRKGIDRCKLLDGVLSPGTVFLSACFLVFKVTQRTLLVKKDFYLQNRTSTYLCLCILLFSDNLANI